MPTTRVKQAIDDFVYPPEFTPSKRTTVTLKGDVYDLAMEVAEKIGTSLSGVVNILIKAAAQDALEWVQDDGIKLEETKGLTALGMTALEDWIYSDPKLQELTGEAAAHHIVTYAQNLAQQPGMSYPEEASAPGKAVRA